MVNRSSYSRLLPGLAVAALALVLGLRWSAELTATDPYFPPLSPSAAPLPASAVEVPSDLPGTGFVIWESNRPDADGGRAWRLWTRRFGDEPSRIDSPVDPPRRLTPDEGRRAHCCPHIAPDGDALAYVSLEPWKGSGPERYPDGPERGVLRLVDPRGGKLLAEFGDARTYGEHRAAIWHDRRTLVYLDGPSGATVRLRLSEDWKVREREVLAAEGHPKWGYLVNSALTHATHGVPTFSLFDAERGEITEMQAFGGCQPYFSPDGRWGYWTSGAGGPIDKIELATRRVSEILAKNDPRLDARGTPARGYLYFPMLSPDQRLLAFAASDGEHHHFSANYDVYLVEVHPDDLTVVGAARRITDDPATDRFPAVFLEHARRPPPDPPPPPPPLAEREDGWPLGRGDLLFVWRTADAANLIFDRRRGLERSFPVDHHGFARLDHYFRLDLGEGYAEVAEVGARAVLEGAQGANAVAVELVATPRRADQRGALFAFSGGRPKTRNLVLRQEGRELVVELLTAGWGPVENRFELGPLASDPGRTEVPVHLLVTYRPGRLAVYRDGEPLLETSDAQGDFFHWQRRPLRLGGEAGDEATWEGTLEYVAIHRRFVSAEEARASFERSRAARRARPDVAQARVRAVLVERTPTPTLAEITPYHEALAVDLWRIEETHGKETLDGALTPGKTVRVARWAILDDRETPASRRRVGEVAELDLELFSKNPQLRRTYLGERLSTSASESPLLLEVRRGRHRPEITR